MSSVEEKDAETLKAGHPPAVKAGGMRITQHKTASTTPPAEKPKPDEAGDAEEEEPSPPKPDLHHQQLLLSGAVTKGDKDFPPAAVKSFHEKPAPTHDKPRPQQHGQHHIQQPRK